MESPKVPTNASDDTRNASVKQVHDIAARGFELDTNAYETARPSYPPEAIELLRTKLGLKSGESRVLDLGAGTGIFTRLLQPFNYDLVAVEPAANMRAKFSQVLPDVPILEGTAWKIPVEDSSLDVVFVAQAFHWFSDVAAIQEFSRVLKPNGYLALIWNLEDRAQAKWVGAIRDIYEKHERGSPQYRLGLWRKVFETEEYRRLFDPPTEAHLQREVLSDKQTIWTRISSKSYVASLDAEQKETLKQQILDTLNSAEDMEIDKESGLVKFPYVTDIVWCQKRA
ncbi:S-adenosyl-L-methionine-dependent methyltransferase [Basidiobolus meristosporus CBS 931.73]|uniref:S-adenosyl-L-methionine-dependent methyltransferase n=1 Tax=Basidiobolus meristosporus CBS 931.73 TaxID=1314790 RepID=A0A1Y1XH05_9FUNG|nr:S-adenosyl-L-methionine-dependent methyltransferase [Basidiobolus meristosporus CBS 931.73]|eukprot:ORX85039.1 S-adenosyl-L-methionine-dependent methyltransferase [Basidiobolus meristosporus CBS 931.73]